MIFGETKYPRFLVTILGLVLVVFVIPAFAALSTFVDDIAKQMIDSPTTFKNITMIMMVM